MLFLLVKVERAGTPQVYVVLPALYEVDLSILLKPRNVTCLASMRGAVEPALLLAELIPMERRWLSVGWILRGENA